MSQEQNSFKRWHDEDPIVSKCIQMLENIQESIKRKTATFLMNEIINKSPYDSMLPDEVFALVTSETRKRRWYDADEVIRLFVELLKNCTPEAKKEICIKAINFMEGLTLDYKKSIELSTYNED